MSTDETITQLHARWRQQEAASTEEEKGRVQRLRIKRRDQLIDEGRPHNLHLKTCQECLRAVVECETPPHLPE